MIAYAELVRRYEAGTTSLCTGCPFYARGCPDPGGNTVPFQSLGLPDAFEVSRAQFCELYRAARVNIEEFYVGGTAGGRLVARGSAEETLAFDSTTNGSLPFLFVGIPPGGSGGGEGGSIWALGPVFFAGTAFARLVASGSALETISFYASGDGLEPSNSVVTFGSTVGGGVKYAGAATTSFRIRLIDK